MIDSFLVNREEIQFFKGMRVLGHSEGLLLKS